MSHVPLGSAGDHDAQFTRAVAFSFPVFLLLLLDCSQPALTLIDRTDMASGSVTNNGAGMGLNLSGPGNAWLTSLGWTVRCSKYGAQFSAFVSLAAIAARALSPTLTPFPSRRRRCG